ncbi:MAG: T9SS type A sorting domain-containing protein [Bacteroidetes bacterium]|nr:T9SS type A sorting domain-containing protein [Bacteroidota bacterium]
MKKTISSILLLISLVPLFNNVNAQEEIKILKKENSKIKPLIKAFIKYNNNDSIYTIIDNKNYLLQNNHENKTKTKKDTNDVDLTLIFDMPYPIIFMASNDTAYGLGFDFQNPYTAKIKVQADTYKIFTNFDLDRSKNRIPTRTILKENILIDSINDTLYINSSEANHIVLYKGLDENGNLICDNINSYRFFALKFHFPYCSYIFQYIGYGYNGFYISDMIDSSCLYCSETLHNVDTDITLLNLNHPVITEINQDVLELINSPDVYTKQYVEINQPANNDNKDLYLGYLSLDNESSLQYYISDTVCFSEQNKQLIKLYLTPDFNSLFTYAFFSVYKDSYNYNIYRVVNHSATIFDYQHPTSDLYLSPAGDTLILGKGLMFLKNRYHNNRYDDIYIDISPHLFFQMKDNHYSEFTSSVFNLYDSTKTLIKSTNTGWDVTKNLEVAAGKYCVEFIDTSYYVSGKRGKATMYNYFDLKHEDALPPVFNALQIRNSNNKPVEKLNTNETGTIHFSCADTYFGDYRSLYYKSILADSTKVYLKQYETSEWTEISPEIICEDTVVYGGYYYKAIIPNKFTAFNSSAIDLKIVFQDSSGNKTDYTLEPAVAVGKFQCPYDMPVTVADYYEVNQDDTLTVTNENSVLSNDEGEKPFILTAKLINEPQHGTINFNSDGTFVYYPEQAYIGTDSLTYKAINGDEIYSIEQKIVINIKKFNAINETQITSAGLSQNFPNPFSGNTSISYVLDNNSKVELTIYNQTGQHITTLVKGYITKGKHTVTWQGTDKYGKAIPSGIYYYKLKTENKAISKSAVFIK